MLDLALFPSIYAVISEQAGKRGYKSPLYGAAGVVIFTFLSGCIEHVIDSALSPDTFVLLVMRLVIGATSSIVVVVLFLRLLPYGNSRTTRKASLIPYSLIGLATLVLAGVNAWHWADEVRDSIGRFGGLNPAWLPGLALSWLLFASSLYCFRLFRQQRLPTLDEELKRDPRPPILLLRSFAVDSVRPPPLWAFLLPRFFRNVAGLSFDDFLASSVRKRLGPFVGLGDPNDYLPTPGVTRVYQDDANWQDAVLDLVRRAGAVILVEGSTPGFRWEMTQVRRLCRPEKVFVIIPPTEYRVSASGRFVIFMSEAGFEIPVYSIDGVLVGFDEKYQAFVLKKTDCHGVGGGPAAVNVRSE